MTAQKINAERIVLLGWSRAILLQMAHPLIAAGGVEHSHFRAGAMATGARLRSTVRSMLALTFGDAATHGRAIAAIRAIHDRVNGRLRRTVGPFAAGTPYSANDPALLLWVHATLLDSVVLAYDSMVAPLSAGERDAYCRDAAPIAVELGAPADEAPTSWASLQQYLADEFASGRITVGDDARVVAQAVLYPPLPALTGPVASVNRLVTAGWLPDRLRGEYRLAWNGGRARQLALTVRWLRTLRRLCPDFASHWAPARA